MVYLVLKLSISQVWPLLIFYFSFSQAKLLAKSVRDWVKLSEGFGMGLLDDSQIYCKQLLCIPVSQISLSRKFTAREAVFHHWISKDSLLFLMVACTARSVPILEWKK